jgi:hypothetical protein
MKFDCLRTIAILILFSFIFTGGTCFKSGGTEPDDLCGAIKEWDRKFEPLDYKYTSVDNGIREFIYYDTTDPEDICSEEHVNAYFEVFCKQHTSLPPDSLKVYGEAYWSLFGNSDEMEYSPSSIPYTYRGYLEIGLKQAFPGKPGSVGLQVVIRFPTQGDIKLDQDYLNLYIDEIALKLNYREYI